MKSITLQSLILILVCFFNYCNPAENSSVSVSDDVADGTDRLSKTVLSRFNASDSLKQVAGFIIDNLKYHYYLSGSRERAYMDSIDKNHLDKELLRKNIRDLKNKYFEKSKRIYDATSLSGDFLVQDLRQSWQTYKKVGWHKQLSFENYKEFIVPYRVEDEGLEHSVSWRKVFKDKFITAGHDSVFKEKDITSAAILIHAWLKKAKEGFDMKFGSKSENIPNLPLVYKDKLTTGTCHELTLTTIGVLRALGLPAARDFTPRYFNIGIGHEWTAIVLNENKCIPFDIQTDSVSKFKLDSYKLAKVSRVSFVPVKDNHYSERGYCSFLPQPFNDPFLSDVTHLYGDVSKLELGIQPSVLKIVDSEDIKYAYLSTFGLDSWVAIDWGRIEGDQMLFNKLGRGGVFLPMIISEQQKIAAADAFILHSDGQVEFLKPDTTHTVSLTLLRKYTLWPGEQDFTRRMVGGIFQGANRPDFSDASDLFIIQKDPLYHFNTIKLADRQKYRYIRYVGPPKSYSNIAEIELYASEKLLKGSVIGTPGSMWNRKDWTIDRVFDGDILTYFAAPKPDSGWVGLDLGKPVAVDMIRYIARNSKNAIYKGMSYELFYWDSSQNGWQSMGKQTAKDNFLIYDNAPANALFWLRNWTEGREERVFTYKNGTQIWW